MSIVFNDLGAQYKELKSGIDRAINGVIKKGDFILGREVGLFEEDFARFCGSRYAVGVSSGTAALFLALVSLGVKAGDEVLVPSFTYIATAMAVSYTGATPVFIDIEENTYNIDPKKIKRAVSRNTRAIIPVHLFGQPAKMPEIMGLARTYRLAVIEDAAQAHGAGILIPGGKWRAAGSLGKLGCFSFYPSKNLGGMGDGGLVTTDSKDLYLKLTLLRDQGRISKYDHAIIGYNSRLDTVQAAVLRVKLKRLRVWNRLRRKNVCLYNRFFKGSAVMTPYESPGLSHVYHVYAIRVKGRDKVYQELRRRGIGALIHYPLPLHLQKAYRDLGYRKGDFPMAEKVCGEIISLPMHPYLKEEQIKYVVDSVKEALNN